jgi:hypothetical protein
VLSTETAPLSIINPDDTASFAQSIAARLSEDIMEHYTLITRLLRRPITLYILYPNCHLDSDLMQRNECRHAHAHLHHDNPAQRELMRRTVETVIPDIVEANNLPFTHYPVTIVLEDIYMRSEEHDVYQQAYLLRVDLQHA